jgi:S1-C subfamily serine protease
VLVGSSADLRVWQKVFAIGHPYGLERTLTTGVISGLDRVITSVGKSPIAGVVQTDAAINPGNSGGPLLDSAGRLIGINTAIYSESGDSAGIGFAVPVDTINEVVPVLISSGVRERPALGIYPAGEGFVRRFGITGAVIGGVAAGSGAERAGLRPLRELPDGGYELDVIVAIDGTPVRRWSDLFLILADKSIGDEVEVELQRDGERAVVRVRLQGVR